jgi:hypothetical protein
MTTTPPLSDNAPDVPATPSDVPSPTPTSDELEEFRRWKSAQQPGPAQAAQHPGPAPQPQQPQPGPPPPPTAPPAPAARRGNKTKIIVAAIAVALVATTIAIVLAVKHDQDKKDAAADQYYCTLSGMKPTDIGPKTGETCADLLADVPGISWTFIVHGAIDLKRYALKGVEGEPCEGSGGFNDIVAGAQVTVTDAAGNVVALGRLRQGAYYDDFPDINGVTGCRFEFTVEDVPEGSLFGIEVARRGVVQFSRADAGDVGLLLDGD